jgi:hypothetical protein
MGTDLRPQTPVVFNELIQQSERTSLFVAVRASLRTKINFFHLESLVFKTFKGSRGRT